MHILFYKSLLLSHKENYHDSYNNLEFILTLKLPTNTKYTLQQYEFTSTTS